MTSNYIGNLSTIIKTVSMIIAGWLLGTLAANNLNLGVDEATLSQVISSLIFLGLAYIDAKYPNTFKFLGNNPSIETIPAGEIVLNEEYTTEVEMDDTE